MIDNWLEDLQGDGGGGLLCVPWRSRAFGRWRSLLPWRSLALSVLLRSNITHLLLHQRTHGAPVVSSPSMRWRAWRGRRRWRKGVANNGYFYLFLKYEILPPSWHSAWAFNHLEHKMQIDLWIKKLESDRCFPRQPSPSSRSSLSTSGSSRSFLKTLKLSSEAHFLSSPQHFVVMRAMHILLFYAYFSCPDIFPWRGHFGQNSITWVKKWGYG